MSQKERRGIVIDSLLIESLPEEKLDSGRIIPLREELDLIHRIQRDGLKAFGELYSHFFHPVFGLVYSRTNDPHRSEDIASETFARALDHIHGYRYNGSSISSWLNTIAYNIQINQDKTPQTNRNTELSRFEASDKSTTLPSIRHDEDVENRIVHNQDVQYMLDSLEELPGLKNAVLRLTFFEELHPDQIASRLGISSPYVRVTKYRALRDMRQKIEQKRQSAVQ